MKRRLFLIIMLVAVTLSGMAQNIGEAFYIYRNDGQFNAFFRDEVLSIEYSYEDADGNKYDEIVTQIVNTADSVYKIPLAAIDSVGFVQPEPILKEGVKDLSGDLLDYILSVEGMTIKLKKDIPSSLCPVVGEKLVQLYYTELFPDAFAGQVTQVLQNRDNIEVLCDIITYEDAVKRYYGVYEVTSFDNYSYTPISLRTIQTGIKPFRKQFELGEIPIHLGAELMGKLWKQDEMRDHFLQTLGGNADIAIKIKPKFDIKVTFSVDEFLGIYPRYQLHLFSAYNLLCDINMVGALTAGGKIPVIPKDLPDVPTVIPGVTTYIQAGTILEGLGELGIGVEISKSGWHILDADIYPIIGTLLPPISIIRQSGGVTSESTKWKYATGNLSIKIGGYFEPGFGLLNHKIARVGADIEFGLKSNIHAIIPFDDWSRAESSSDFYDKVKDECKVNSNIFFGAKLVFAALDDRLKFSAGGEINFPSFYDSFLFPTFNNVSLTQNTYLSTTLDATTNVERDCLFPLKIGVALFDSNLNHKETQFFDNMYFNHSIFKSNTLSFANIMPYDKYYAFPVVNFFGKNVLASPYAEYSNKVPVAITQFEQTNAQYSKAAFTNEDKNYDFCYNAAITVAIDDMTDVDDWGYVYEDPDGKIAHISLKGHESPYTDTNYAFYRNEPTSTACLYGYVKYQGDENYYYGEKTEYSLVYDKQPQATTQDVVEVSATTAKVRCGYMEVAPWGGVCGVEYWKDSDHQELLFETANAEIDVLLSNLTPETTYSYRAFIKVEDKYYRAEETKSFTTQSATVNICPDDHHPHVIDLGLPSGTKWACCNVGAAKPEDYGGFYDIGEAFEKAEYSWENYPYRDVNLGEDIAGTSYDVAYVLWGKEWNTPSLTQFKELVDHTTFKAVTQNGVFGGLFTSETGQSIFLPAAGYKLAILHDENDKLIKEYYHAGERGSYWTSSQYAHREGDTDSMYEMFFSKENNVIQPPTFDAANNFWGLPLRAVQPGIVVETGDATEVTETSATLNGTVKNYDEANGQISFVFLLSTSEDIINSSDKRIIEATYNGNGIINATVTNLSDNSTYYYMLAAIIDGEYQYACNKKEFWTSAVIKIEMKKTTNISYTSATIAAVCSMPEYSGMLKYKKEGDDKYVERWIEGFTNGEMQCDIDHLEIDAKYYCCASIFIGGETIESDTISFRTNNICPNDNHPHLIDLGLGLKWSCCNVGASNPEDAGGYYSWGETIEKQNYSNDNYVYRGKNEIGTEVFITIGPDISKSEYDVAYLKMGNQYRMPTKEEMNKLCQYSPSYWASKNGVQGHLFVGDNGNAIFLPAAGSKLSALGEYNNEGCYWSSNIYIDDSDNNYWFAYYLKFLCATSDTGGVSSVDWTVRSYGMPVRAVEY